MEFNGKDFLNDLEWRGLVASTSGNITEMFNKQVTFYLGTDCTSIPDSVLLTEHQEITTSLHVGHLLAFITAKRFQMYGHKPIILIGKSTAAVGDLAGRTKERDLISYDRINQNAKCLEEQIKHLLDFESGKENQALMLTNEEWLGKMNLIDYARDFGKLIPINYMLAKDSVKLRLENGGLSLCEFLYSTLQGVDMYHLYKNYGCTVQIGGDDQQGSMSYGSMLVRKLLGHDTECCTLTWPLITKSDGTKFGKSEGGCVYLNKHLTSPYEFYQFWLNQSDEDGERFIKMFTLLSKEDIEALIEEHRQAPHLRKLQKVLSKEVTVMVHGEEEYNLAVEASNVLFGDASIDTLKKLDDNTMLSVFDGCPTFNVDKSTICGEGVKLVDLAVEKANVFKSKGELRKLIQNGGVSLNKSKVTTSDMVITKNDLINDKYLIFQQGKKKYSLVVVG